MLIFAVLKRRLLQKRETEVSFVSTITKISITRVLPTIYQHLSFRDHDFGPMTLTFDLNLTLAFEPNYRQCQVELACEIYLDLKSLCSKVIVSGRIKKKVVGDDIEAPKGGPLQSIETDNRSAGNPPFPPVFRALVIVLTHTNRHTEATALPGQLKWSINIAMPFSLQFSWRGSHVPRAICSACVNFFFKKISFSAK